MGTQSFGGSNFTNQQRQRKTPPKQRELRKSGSPVSEMVSERASNPQSVSDLIEASYVPRHNGTRQGHLSTAEMAKSSRTIDDSKKWQSTLNNEPPLIDMGPRRE